MVKRDELKKLSKLRLNEAKVLFENELYDGVKYLSGYVIELALKARICRILDQEEYLDGCRKANQEMIDIVNDLLDATKIEEGRFLFDYKKVQIEDLIQETIESLEGEAIKKQIEIIFKRLNGLAPLINADAEKLSIAMKNILENAVKYTFKGGKVYVSLEKDPESIIIKIRDTGVGIPKPQQQRIFEKFFRAENALTTETSGTGLGLYIAKNIIEKHGGKIWFTSEENIGTTFTFTIPIAP